MDYIKRYIEMIPPNLMGAFAFKAQGAALTLYPCFANLADAMDSLMRSKFQIQDVFNAEDNYFFILSVRYERKVLLHFYLHRDGLWMTPMEFKGDAFIEHPPVEVFLAP